MAKIRKLKKDINYISFELLAEVFTFKHFHPDMEEKKFDEVIKKIVSVRNELMVRINQKDIGKDNKSQKQHFMKIREDLVEMLLVVDEMTK